ncbi:MAG: phosphoribosylamine--glycine ligase [Methylococcales bacterium]|jgi:phosphoribosylamine---glycine ligase|nr:phosphoribosylamine--glycine ligase [Methylococcales bacterium]MBT7408913.1 phosphoribosylamine--glycine ligase [Methylococcales bacterium]
MNILIVGNGGREHALAWKCSQSERVETVYVAPGNAGTQLEDNIENIDLSVSDTQGLIEFAQQQQIALTIIGPEVPLVNGIVDAFQAEGLNCFGPSKKASQLEGSKSFTKDFLARHRIPTSSYGTFTDIPSAESYLDTQQFPIVIKADGLAAGKGVIIAQSREQAVDAVRDMLKNNSFGDAGHKIVIEEFLTGEEASFIAMIDGKNILPMATSQDHKARDNGDTGPNTGGMGAYSPAPVVTPAIYQRVIDEVIRPTVDGLNQESMPYTGFLYAGLMIATDGSPKVLEYNCRFGDPETQPIMMRLESDLVDLCFAALEQKLDTIEAKWSEKSALGVVLAAGGYPESYEKEHVISGLESDLVDTKIFHAGTKLSTDNEVLTNGGRVLCACALGDNVTDAQKKAYELVDQISWSGVFNRTDIGYRAVLREKI